MIRRILLFVFLIFTIVWFAIAYTIKSNLVTLIKNSESDNVKISYSHAKISGYPFHWNFSLTDVKVKFIDRMNYRELTTPKVNLKLDFSTKKSIMNFGGFIKVHEGYGDKVLEYIARSKKDLEILVKFNKHLYSISKDDDLKAIIKSIKAENTQLSVAKDGNDIFDIKDLLLFVRKTIVSDREDMLLSLSMNYHSEEDLLNFKSANLDLATAL